MKTGRPPLARHRLARWLALAILPVTLSSCNLLFLNLGYKNEAPEAESLEVRFEEPYLAPAQYPSPDGYLWPEVSFRLEDDSGIKELSCSVSSDDGTKSFTLANNDPRSRYVWTSTRPLADVLGSGLNRLSFTVTDEKGLTTTVEKEFSVSSDGWGLSAYLGSTKKEILLWHPAGIASASYRYVGSGSSSDPVVLSNLDDGSGPGGTKLFRGERSETMPVDMNYNGLVVNVTLKSGENFDSRQLPLSAGE